MHAPENFGMPWLMPLQCGNGIFRQLQEFKPVVGFAFHFNRAGAGYQNERIVTEVVEGKTFAHSWAYKATRKSQK